MRGLRRFPAAILIACGAVLAVRGAARAAIADPTDIAGLQLWLDAQDVDGDGLPDSMSDTDPIAAWVDKSTNGRDLSQGTAADQPLYRTGQLNGCPVVMFDGANDRLSRSGMSMPAREIFAVAMARSTTDGNDGLLSRGVDDDLNIRAADNTAYRGNAGHGTDGNDFVNGAGGTISINGAATDSFVAGEGHCLDAIAANDKTFTDFVAGDCELTVWRPWDGYIAEIIVYDRVLTGVERSWIEEYLRNKWLPGGLVAHYELDETSPGAVVNSVNPGTDDGANNGAVIDQPGKVGGAYEFNGTDSFVAADPADWSASAYTVALWAKAASAVQPEFSSVFNNDSATNDFQIDLNGGTPRSYRWRGGTNHLFGEVTTEWVHLAVTWDGTTLRLYYDGGETASAALAPGSAGENFSVYELGRNRNADNWFAGLIDDVRIYDRALWPEEVAGLAGGLEAGLMAHYRLDHDGADDEAIDSSGNGNTGTLTNMEAGDWVAGQVSGALDFDGSDEYVDLTATTVAVAGSGARTIAAWVRTTAGGYRVIASTGTPANNEAFIFLLADGHPSVMGYNYDWYKNSGAAPAVTDGAWHHVAVTLDAAGTLTSYVDGVVDNSEAGRTAYATSGQNNFIGKSNHTGFERWFQGSIDDLRFYGRALSAGEMYDLAGGLDSGLVAHYELDEGVGPTAFDSTANHFDGTLTGSPTWTATAHIGPNALDFDGTDDHYVETGKTASELGIGGNNARTVALWCYTRAFNGGGLFSIGPTSTGNQFCLRTLATDNEWRIQYWAGDYDFNTDTGTGFTGGASSGIASLGNWVHFAHVHDGTNTYIYVNGELKVTWAKTIDTTDDVTCRLGYYNGTDYYDGILDDVRIYNRALLAAEISGLFNAAPPATVNIAIPASGLVTTEDAGSSSHTATFTVALGDAPTADVTVDVSSSDTSEGVIEGATAGVLTLVFTTSDWDTPQTVSVTGVDDDFHDLHVRYTVDMAVSSTDAEYQGLIRAVSATNRDDEIGTNLVAWWRLDEAAGASTAVNSASPGTFDGAVSDPANMPGASGRIGGAYNFGGDDRITTSMPGPHNTDLTWSAWIRTTAGGAIIANTNGTWMQGGKSLFVAGGTLELDVGWVGNPDTGFTVDDGAWHHVVLTVVDSGGTDDTIRMYVDAVERLSNTNFNFYAYDGAFLKMRIGDCPGMGDFFDGDIDDVRVYDRALLPAEVQGLYERGFTTVMPTYGLVTSEDPAAANHTATFEVFLSSAPAADVTISLSSSDTGEGTIDGAVANVLDLVFTPSGPTAWDVPQTVTVTGGHDDVVDGDATYTIVLSATASADASFDGLEVTDVWLTNLDDDTAGVTVAPTAITTDEDPASAGHTATFSVELTSEPVSDVTISLSSSDTLEGTIDGAAGNVLILTFTNSAGASPWDTAQTVTITGFDEDVDDGDAAYTIIASNASSADLLYDDFAVPDIPATNIDDDTAGITLGPPSGLATTEAGAGTDTFTVVLDSEPEAPVTISVSSSDTTEGTVSVGVLVFTDANWDSAFTVTVTGVNDDLGDGHVPYYVDLGPAASGDPHYNGRVESVAVTNEDDEPFVYVDTALTDALAQEHATAPDDAAFTVVCESRAGTSVTVDVDVQVTFAVGGTAVRGASGDYVLYADATPIADATTGFTIPAGGAPSSVTIYVKPQDDDLGEGPEGVVFSLVARPDGKYYAVEGPSTDAATILDDEPVVTVVASAPSASEPAVPGEFTVTRTMDFREDEAFDIHFTLAGTATAGADYVTIPPSPVTIPANEESAAVTVVPVDDRREEGDETVTLAIVRNGALGYTVGAPGAASVTIADDERPGIGGGTGCAPGAVPAGGAGAAWGLVCIAAAALVRRRARARWRP